MTNKQSLFKKFLKLEKQAEEMQDRASKGLATSQDIKDSWLKVNAAYEKAKK